MALFSRRSTARPLKVEAPEPARATPHQPDTASEAVSERRIVELGRDLLDRARGHKAGVLSARFYSDRLMNWSLGDPGLKVQLFRFVDAFPSLKTPEAIHDHLVDSLTQPGVKLPPGMDLGLRAGGVAKGLLASTIAGQIRSMASKFIAGVDAASAVPGLRGLWRDGIAFSVDLLGEACVSEEEADAYRDKYLDLVSNLPAEAASWPSRPVLEADHLGPIPRVNVSIKVSSLSARCDPIDPAGAIADLSRRLLPILESARDRNVHVNFDMEQDSLRELTLELFRRCAERLEFSGGVALQAYLRSGVEDARRLAAWAVGRRRLVTVRLVKGAYWDYETIHAEQMGWPCPVWATKRQTDACFEAMAAVLLDATPPSPARAAGGGVRLAVGSHNARSIAAALAFAERRGLPHAAVELQMLHGMADQLKHAAAEMGLRVREYVPVGETIPGMAYLVRRLLENTSNESWLKAGFLDQADPSVLLAAPGPVGAPAGGSAGDGAARAAERHALSPAREGVGDGRPFFNEPFRDFSRAGVRDAFAAAVSRAAVPRVESDRTPDQGRAMVAAAAAAFPAWRATDARVRAAVLVGAAAEMRSRRDELAGVMIRESGKTWREADADVCEAIDFCEFYARCAPPLFDRRRLGRFVGELDEAWHEPRGVAVVISPWNFPLAICCGMTAAALVTGNTVIVKPAEQTPGVASILCDVLRRAGAPEGVLHFCPAPGETTGAALVRDPRVAVVAFTGSKAVGLDIVRACGDTADDQRHVKRVVCEMGGKNAVIVDASADLDEAVLGVRQSAFGFQGQKCSACSRVIVVDDRGPAGPAVSGFVRRLVESTRSLVVGDPSRPGTDIGPVIDAEARDRIARFIEAGRRDATLAFDGGTPVVPGCEHMHFVGPHIFSGVAPGTVLATEEIFGPVVAVMHAATFAEALSLANDSVYRLTGGVYTRKPSHIERAKREFRVGNLYVNRGITGALVGRQPFGGAGLSGLGSKAGGVEYLLHFVDPRASCENTMRRGFAPEL